MTRSFAALLLTQACFGYAFSSFLLLPKFLVTELAAGPAEIGRVMAIYGITIVVFMPIVGGLVDRLGRRDFLTAGSAIMAATAFAFAAIGEIGPPLYTLRALQGLAFALAFVGGATLAVDQAPPERLGQVIGLFGLTFLAMNAVAPAVVEEVAGSRGWPVAFAAAGGAAIVSIALSRLLSERRARPHSSEVVPGVWEFARRPRQLRTSTVIALAGAALGAVFTFHQPFAIELGMTDVKSFFVAYAAAAVGVRVALGSVVDHAGRRRVSLLCLVAYVLVVSGMSQLRPGWLAVFGALMGMAHGFFYPAYNAMAAEGVGAHERGKMMALFQAAWNSGFALGQVGLGALAERRGYPAVFVAGGICSLAALVVLALSPEGRVPREPRG